MIPIENILKISIEELEKVKQYCADTQAENVAQEMFIKGAQWAAKNLQQPDVIKSVCERCGNIKEPDIFLCNDCLREDA